MNLLHAIVLGIIQGLSEFLPISSTAHLTVYGRACGLIDSSQPQAWTAFIAVMQLGTAAAVIIYFLRDLAAMTRAGMREGPLLLRGKGWSELSHDARVFALVCVGTVPVVILGLGFKDLIEGVFTKSLLVIGSSLIVLAILLWSAEKVARHTRTIREVGIRDAIVVGIGQALALVPGSSRSGTTITAALFLGFTREDAARFSFLLSVPAVLLSGFYQLMKIDPSVFSLGILNLVVATIVSGISGYAAIAWLLRYLMKHTTLVFVWYRLGLGSAILLLLAAGAIAP